MLEFRHTVNIKRGTITILSSGYFSFPPSKTVSSIFFVSRCETFISIIFSVKIHYPNWGEFFLFKNNNNEMFILV